MTENPKLILPGRYYGVRHTCRKVSYHPQDVENRYCGACHVFHEDTPSREG